MQHDGPALQGPQQAYTRLSDQRGPIHAYAGGPYTPVPMVHAYPTPMMVRYDVVDAFGGRMSVPVIASGAAGAPAAQPGLLVSSVNGNQQPPGIIMAHPAPGTAEAVHYYIPQPAVGLLPVSLMPGQHHPELMAPQAHVPGAVMSAPGTATHIHSNGIHLANGNGITQHVSSGGASAVLQPPPGQQLPQAVAQPLPQQQSQLQLQQQAGKRQVPRGLEENVRRTIYVSYIDVSVTEEQLASFFSVCGPVMDCRICGDPNSAMRFAFLEFADVQSAQLALAKTGSVLGGWPLKVQPSKTAIVPVSKHLMPRSQDEILRCSRTVYVASIDKHVDRADVRAFFEQLCGPVAKLRLLGDASHNTRIAFVEFVDAEGAKAALNCSGALLGSLPVRVSPSKTPIRADVRSSKSSNRDRSSNRNTNTATRTTTLGSSSHIDGVVPSSSQSDDFQVLDSAMDVHVHEGMVENTEALEESDKSAGVQGDTPSLTNGGSSDHAVLGCNNAHADIPDVNDNVSKWLTADDLPSKLNNMQLTH